jgi:hypothetical protein
LVLVAVSFNVVEGDIDGDSFVNADRGRRKIGIGASIEGLYFAF